MPKKPVPPPPLADAEEDPIWGNLFDWVRRPQSAPAATPADPPPPPLQARKPATTPRKAAKRT